MSAWQWLNLKGTGVTALAILMSTLVASDTWDALVQKSSAPDGSTSWVHLISVLDDIDVGGAFDGGSGKDDEEIILAVIKEYMRRT